MGNLISALKNDKNVTDLGRQTSTIYNDASGLEKVIENKCYQQLLNNTSKDRDSIVHHELFSSIKSIEHIRTFMENHVFAVYDFMTLLKSLQLRFTCIKATWTPPDNRIAARLINEIVTGEETDRVERKVYMSHYELYLNAMKEIGANTNPVLALTSTMKQTNDPKKALEAARNEGASEHALKFVEETFQVSLGENIPDHEVAAYFLFGREDPIPDMFKIILKEFPDLGLKKDFVLYLKRHIHLDENQHAPMAKLLLESLCLEDEQLWQHCTSTAIKATQSRARFLDGVLKQIKN